MDENLVSVVNNENPIINLEISSYENIVDINFLQSIESVISVHDNNEDAHSNIVSDLNLKVATVINNVESKVDKAAGKGLSTNDLTNVLKSNYDTAYSNNHVHNNRTSLDLVSGTNTGDQDLSTLANTVLSNLTLTSALNNLGFRGQSLTSNGYYKFPNGFIIQWGVTGYISGSGAFDVTLPITFPNANLSASVSIFSGYYNNLYPPFVYSLSTSQMRIWQNNSASVPVSWLAIGY